MASITLHRADRIVKSIDKALKDNPTLGVVKLSVFGDVVADMINARQTTMVAIKRVNVLLDARTAIRSAVGTKNAVTGVSSLLASQASLEKKLLVLEVLPGVGAKRPAEEEDIYGRRRNKKIVIEPVSAQTVTSLVMAARARYESAAEGAVTEVDVSSILPEDVVILRAQALAVRRELDTVSDQLRALNSSSTVEVADEIMVSLQTAGVV